MAEPAPCPTAPLRRQPPQLTLADIFRQHGPAYAQTVGVSTAQRKVMQAIVDCRTARLGGHLHHCADCDRDVPLYNSCRNRHCPTCQARKQADWVEQRMSRLLPSGCFHVVFTLPAELKPLALQNRAFLFALLMRTAAATLLELAQDPKRLGAQLGVTTVLHTWSRALQFHPHVHCIVTAGGLSLDGSRWVPAPRYLFPVRVLSALFRGKFIAALRAAHHEGQLVESGPCAPLADPAAWKRFLDTLYQKEWVVYAKRPFAGPRQVLSYLGRYTHRVAISNQRLCTFSDTHVTFRSKDAKIVTLTVQEFIRRFLLHVLPPGFVKIRHFGLWAAGAIPRQFIRARQLAHAHNRTVPLSHLPFLIALIGLFLVKPHSGVPSLAALTVAETSPVSPWALTCPHCGGHRLLPVSSLDPATSPHPAHDTS